MSALRGTLRLDQRRCPTRALAAAVSVFSLTLALPAISWADDGAGPIVADDAFTVSASALDEATLAQTHGMGDNSQKILFVEDEDSGLNQSVAIGSFNDGGGFDSGNAVATAIVQQHAVQIIGAGGPGSVSGN